MYGVLQGPALAKLVQQALIWPEEVGVISS